MAGYLASVRARNRYVEDLIEPWKADHEYAMRVYDLEDAIRSCLRVVPIIEGWRNALRSDLHGRKLPDPDRAGREFLKAIKATLGLFQDLREAVTRAEVSCSVEGSQELVQAESNLKRIAQEFSARWPLIDPKRWAESEAAYQRGEYQSVEEILNELQGGSPKAGEG